MDTIIKDRSCPISGTTLYKKVGEAKDFLYSKETFPLLQNLSSGLVITGNAPQEEELGKYYKSNEYISHTDSHKGILNKVYQLARSFTLPKKYHTIARLFPKEKEGLSLLDIGCGTGHFASYVKKKGYKVYGIEQDDKARGIAQEQGITCFSSLLDATLPSSSFDLLTLWHVLEHIDSLPLHFKAFKNLLRKDGYLVIAVPNYTGFDCRFYRNNWAAYDVPRHLWHFSPETLVELANKEGFYLVKKKTMPLDAFYIALLSEKNKGTNRIIACIKAFAIGGIGFLWSLIRKDESSSLVYFLKKRD